jgi:hypothetical protein
MLISDLAGWRKSFRGCIQWRGHLSVFNLFGIGRKLLRLSQQKRAFGLIGGLLACSLATVFHSHSPTGPCVPWRLDCQRSDTASICHTTSNSLTLFPDRNTSFNPLARSRGSSCPTAPTRKAVVSHRSFSARQMVLARPSRS